MMNYRVENIFETYPKGIKVVSANTPYDASEKAIANSPWRHKDDLVKQIVTILDGTKRTWMFEK